MAMTNAEKQARARAKRSAKIERYEAALREIVRMAEYTSPTRSEFNQGCKKAWAIASSIAETGLGENL